eukprot:TRINITY_DN4833_c0_g1_i3.p1 TRINITY_DN4833_c0_g1~~TRINITY_DN4833_c0_g1_i3.p1  ORF type:complete len:199 (-),score=97.62 TRINITY_DN4833_c0_g1_i3:78-674(-)
MESLSDSEEYYSVASYDDDEDEENTAEALEFHEEDEDMQEKNAKNEQNNQNNRPDLVKKTEFDKRSSREMVKKKPPLPIPPKPMKFMSSPHISLSSPSLLPTRGASHDPESNLHEKKDSVGFSASTLGGVKKREENVEEEVEFVIKNLDTMESFSSKKMDQLIPKAIDPKLIDPIAKSILKRDLDSGKEEKEEEEKPR